ncbi:hypothetical protein [uncultured Bacteroides sp.]|uniref:hypothetical protein n=1 Tax=uncultured Bacteroides sp. TaxID=162156 RepID=UPI00261E1EA2|nr:hypothetical protein [uncultured Bacteroides sp.]
MKKKFDFSAEMNDTESIKITPKNEYLEEEKRLLDVNAKELANLNDNVHEMSINLVNLLKFLREYKLTIAQSTQEQAEKIGQSVLDKFLCQIQDKWDETERKIHLADNYVLIPHLVFYILIIILVALSSFFASIIIANAEILHSTLIWKAVVCCTFMAVLGIICTVVIPKLLDKLK